MRPRIPFGAGGVKRSPETPLKMNRKIRRPAGALQTNSATRIGQGFAHLTDRRPRKLPAEARIHGARICHSDHPGHRQETRSNKPQPVCLVVLLSALSSPAPIPRGDNAMQAGLPRTHHTACAARWTHDAAVL
jgi:hypothetical protein